MCAVPVLAGRSALQAYTDLMVSFRGQFKSLLGSVVTDANVGLGPKGELRYPSNPLDDRWNFPGIGEFQVCSGSAAGVAPCPLRAGTFFWQ
jgi:beta-amylase